MKAYRFKPELTPTGELKLPSQLKAELVARNGGADSVVVFLDGNEDSDWPKLTAQQFLEGYDDTDSIYDALV